MKRIRQCFTVIILMALSSQHAVADNEPPKKIAYIVSDSRIHFWDILLRGIDSSAQPLNYQVIVYSADNSRQKELQNTIAAIRDKVSGIILSPVNSSSAVTVLKLANQANIPVVIADVGSDSNDFISYISSDNFRGAFNLGQMLINTMKKKGWRSGTVGIIAIPQKRENGRARTRGFLEAITTAGYKSANIHQLRDFSYKETYDFAASLIKANPNMRAIWLQTSQQYQAAIDAIAEAQKQNEILLICFDAEPEFTKMIASGRLVGAGMQQPFLMGEQALETLDKHLNGESVEKTISLPVLSVSQSNLSLLLPDIQRNVLGKDIQL
ncbi:substrate-binding domain-containing protein [Enterovibrio sp. 27052020O]|uniref:substrate-binding domain-containing protein n=1 Tax=Enterovibrio sp. 27052020O TaxID=3241166 RepID=UPI00388EE96B